MAASRKSCRDCGHLGAALDDPMYGPAVRRKRISSICRHSGLASMYPASDWSGCSGPSWMSARMRSHYRPGLAPCSSRPTTWNEFLPMSMPIVAPGEFALLDMVLLCFVPHPSIIRWRAGAWPPHPVSGGAYNGSGLYLECFLVHPVYANDAVVQMRGTALILEFELCVMEYYCCWLCSGKHNTSAGVRGHGAVLVERMVGRTHYLRPFGNTL